MIFMIVFLFSAIAALGLGLVAGWSDFRGMTIPNYIPAGIFAAFLVGFAACSLGDVHIFLKWQAHAITGISVFLITFIMFAMKAIGGGDAKLATAFAFWVGLKALPVYLSYMVLSGGVIGLVALVLKASKPVKNPPEGSWIARVQAGDGVVPYGIPIAIGAFAAFLSMEMLSPGTLQRFLISN